MRVPQGDFRNGDMEALPFADHQFDVVTGFNSFQYAADPVNALREARRVARPGSPVVVAVWGKREDIQAASVIAAFASLLPPPPPNTPGPFALSQEGALEALVTQAGLTPKKVAEVDCLWSYADKETALRGFLSAGPAVRIIQIAGEPAVKEAAAKALVPFKTANGGYELRNRFLYLIATA
jgi:SAM-dependent methyltransferase